MTYKDLKDFCSALTEEQLQQEVYLSQVDDVAIKVETALVTEEDTYYEHGGDGLGTLTEVKQENPDDWEEVIADAIICRKGTVMLINE